MLGKYCNVEANCLQTQFIHIFAVLGKMFFLILMKDYGTISTRYQIFSKRFKFTWDQFFNRNMTRFAKHVERMKSMFKSSQMILAPTPVTADSTIFVDVLHAKRTLGKERVTLW